MTVDPPDQDGTDLDARIEAFWTIARNHAHLNSAPQYFGVTPMEVMRPPAWGFGATSEQADALLRLVLAGTKTATASALWDYQVQDESLPTPGLLDIVLDGSGRPRALIETTAVEVRAFHEVDAEHARLEGEGDLSLEYWRRTHEAFFRTHAAHDRGFSQDMPVVLQRFRLVYKQ